MDREGSRESPIERFRAAMRAGAVQVGVGIGFSDPLASEALAGSLDFLWIDLEHSPLGPESLAGHHLAARARATPALVRVPSVGTAFVKPVLDLGADGVIVPQVRTVEEVRRTVADCRYPPLGDRGFGPRVPSDYGRMPTHEYVAAANRQLFVAVMIETVEALADIDAIVGVPGLDSVVIGPWDLSGSMGMLGEVEHPRVLEAVDRIVASARSAGIFVGAGMGVSADYAVSMARRGCQWLQVGGDYGYLVWAADTLKAAIARGTAREGPGGSPSPRGRGEPGAGRRRPSDAPAAP
jgi:2-keto-3-deoxy-L-rhamnonate aldolase RhmA